VTSQTGGHLKLQAEFGARSSGPEQIHDTYGNIVTGIINSVGPSLGARSGSMLHFGHGGFDTFTIECMPFVLFCFIVCSVLFFIFQFLSCACGQPCSQQSTYRIHARITPMSHTQ
jgi:hypothetical protein